MRILLQADADLNEEIVIGAIRREPAIDFKTAEETGLRGLADLEVLARAASESRVLVSHDRHTMPKHFADFISSIISRLLLVSAESQKEDARPRARQQLGWRERLIVRIRDREVARLRLS